MPPGPWGHGGSTLATLEAVGTATPEHTVRQEELRALAQEVLPDSPAKPQMLEVFENSGIRERALARPLPWYLEGHGHKARNQAFLDASLPLCETAARRALEEAGRHPDEIGAIAVVTTTGIVTPSLDARLTNALELAPDVIRAPIWGLGCAGGVAGLNRGADLATAHPEAPVLVVCVELCSLQFSLQRALAGPGEDDDLDKKSVIAATLFGDGAAAMVLDGSTGRPGGLEHAAGASHLFPDTERVMGWDVEDETLDVVLSPRIPQIAREELAGIVHPFLDEQLGSGRRPDHWVLHPGGAKVLEAFKKALGLSEDEMLPATDALADHGNMSSPTVLFALEETWDAIEPGETALLGALGPGFAAELALLEGA